MWWIELDAMADRLAKLPDGVSVDPSARVAPDAALDISSGGIRISAGAQVCGGARLVGPLEVGAGAMIGNLALVRGPATLGRNVRIGFAAEIKNAILEDDCSVGPQSFVADSLLGQGAYLGAQVRTSNHRLDGRLVEVIDSSGAKISSGREKLGCRIGAGARLGIQVVVLPGRTIAPGSQFGPRITVEKNLPTGRYRIAQLLTAY